MFKFLRGVTFNKGSIHFHKTGVDIPIDRDFIYQVWKITSLHTAIRIANMARFVTGRLPGKSIVFYPQRAGPWYNARIAAEMAGFKVVDHIEDADYQFAFSDDTFTTAEIKDNLRESSVNFDVLDISKSNVGDAFKKVFGYDVKIDPTTFKGEAVEKSENNGTHDGRVVTCPIDAGEVKDGFAYQRLIPTGPDKDFTEDLRLLYIMDKPVVVFHKTKDVNKRFGTDYLEVIPREPEAVFSEDELKNISSFCQMLGLDFGAIDVLRSTDDKKIYIVDVNKTGMPVMCLSLRVQFKAFQQVARQFRAGLEQSQSSEKE